MDALNMISGPVLFVQQLHEHSKRVHQSVELVQPLAEALLAQDQEKIKALHRQMSRIRDEADQIKLSLYDQIQDMHFRSAGGYAVSQYLACQEKGVDSSLHFADLLVLRETTIPSELHGDFRAFVSQVIKVSRQTVTLTEGLSSPAEAVSADTEAQNTLDAIPGTINDNGQVKRLEMKFARHFYRIEKQLDPITIMSLDKYCTTLHEVADDAEGTTSDNEADWK